MPSEKVTQHDKLLVAFDALALSMASHKMPPFGKIAHGSKQKSVKVQLSGLMKTVRSAVERIAAQREVGNGPHAVVGNGLCAVPKTPPLILNKHCTECEFQAQCRQTAIEKERKKQHNKGIFTVTQLSYTFRPRRKPRRHASKPEKYHHALKALAIREGKIHIAGRPALNVTGTPVYPDVEGDPDRGFY